MTPDPRAEYGRRIERWNGEIARADRAHALIANARLALAAAIAVLAWQAFVSHRVSAIWPLVFLAGVRRACRRPRAACFVEWSAAVAPGCCTSAAWRG